MPFVVVALLALLIPLHALSAQSSRADTGWHDPSPHTGRSVVVAPGVQLEVLDWGGTGTPMIFLPGLGNTAHSFDVFAPRFRDAYHVYAITPRGFGASSHPDSGYDSPSRARDVVAVLDSLGLSRAILVGHSIAGDELTRVAGEHPERVRALVYLDAYSYGGGGADLQLEGEPELPPQTLPPPAMTSADSASPAAMTAYWTKRYGVPAIEAEVRAVERFGPTGKLELFQAPNASEQVYLGSTRSEYARVRAPALAIYAVRDRMPDIFPEYATFDSTNRRLARAYVAWSKRYSAAQIGRFRTEMRCGMVREIAGANHYVHYQHADRVERMMRAFLTNRLGRAKAGCRVG